MLPSDVNWIKPAYTALIVLMAAALAPTVVPVLPVETYIRYSAATHLQPPHNHCDVFYCRGLRLPLKEYWAKVKNWG